MMALLQRYSTAALAALTLAVTLLSAPVLAGDNRSAPPPPNEWTATLDRDHPLAGKIYATGSGGGSAGLVPVQELARSMALARFTLLGEVHDNPDHHQWQAWGIRAISKLRGARIVEGAAQLDLIAMEMIRVDQQPALDKFYGRNVPVPRPKQPEALGHLLEWDKSGWPDFAMYSPIVAQARYEQIVIVPASPSLQLGRKVSKDWDNALSEGELTRLKLDQEFSPDLQNALVEEIRDSHCGLMPERAFHPMSRVQRFRDATMADALLSAGPYKGGILIAGNGHVRRDRGVPYFLMARGIPSASIISVAHVEVRTGGDDPATYVPTAPDGTPAVDFVVFTPRVDRPDPCEKMREAMGKHAPATPSDAPPSSETVEPPSRER